MLETANWEAIAHVLGWAMCVILLGFRLDRPRTQKKNLNLLFDNPITVENKGTRRKE